MRIAIDYTSAIAQQAGIGRYTRGLVGALAQVDTRDDFLLFSAEAPNARYTFPTTPRMRSRVIGIAGHAAGNRAMTILWHKLNLPLPVELVIGRADVMHAPDFSLPPTMRTPSIVTIHDLAFLTHPECAVPSLVEYLSAVVPRAVRRADRIVAVSQRTADDLVERLHVPREKIAVIHLGVDPSLRPLDDPTLRSAVESRYGLRHPLVLAVGTLEPRKNYARLIAAFAQARQAPGGPQMLAIVGRKGWLYEGIFAAVAEYGIADAVTFLDYVPDADLPALYSIADVVATPSIYEGFGIPLVEAMASGTPVVCSTGGSLPEIAGDAALIVPPEDVEGLAAALVRVVTEPDLHAHLVTRGLERVRAFSWEAAAEAHIAVYESVAR